MIRRYGMLGLSLVAGLALAGSAAGEQVEITEAVDLNISKTELPTDAPTIEVGNIRGDRTSSMLIRFDPEQIKNIPGRITKATLRLTVADLQPAEGFDQDARLNLGAPLFDADWTAPGATAKTLDGNKPWPGKTGHINDVPKFRVGNATAEKVGQTIEWDVSGPVRLWRDGVEENHGFHIRRADSQGKPGRLIIKRLHDQFDAYEGMVELHSADASDPSVRPTLVIEYESDQPKLADPIESTKRPTPPYRLWYIGEEFITQYPDVVDGMTISTATPHPHEARWLNHFGITSLRWSFGPNSPWAESQAYYDKIYLEDNPENYTWAGFSVDEWANGTPEKNTWTAAALRKAREKFPDRFISVWTVEAHPELIALLKDDVIDLAVIEGYDHVPNLPDWEMGWEKTLQLVEAFKEAGVLDKVIVGHGWIQGEPDNDGDVLTKQMLEEHAEYLKEHYPEMPGIGFFADSNPTPANLEMHRFANELSKRLYPASQE